MFDVLGTVEFWFGAIVLAAYQVGKFSEINTLDPRFERLSYIPNLRTWDFAGSRAFAWSLIMFLLFSVSIYLALCLASPSVIAGYVQITQGASGGVQISNYVQSVPYPLYICALLIGMAHQAIPGFAKIANVQRDLFHHWIGVPSVALDMATSAHVQILSRSPSYAVLSGEVDYLLSNAWQADIRAFADIGFYGNAVRRLNLSESNDDKQDDDERQSYRELKNILELLLVASAIATIRKSGVRGLDDLAGKLRVPSVDVGTTLHMLLVGALGYIFGLTVLTFAIPLLAWPIRSLVGSIVYWPQDINSAFIYILAQVLPTMMAALLLVTLAPRATKPNDRWESATSAATTYAGVLVTILVTIVIYDYLQSFSDYGLNQEAFSGTLGSFFGKWLPYHILHGFISVAVCFVMIRHFTLHTDSGSVTKVWRSTMVLCLVSGALSTFYATARMKFQYDAYAPDYVLLICGLNVAGALIAFYTVLAVVKWRVKAGRPTSLPPVALVPI